MVMVLHRGAGHWNWRQQVDKATHWMWGDIEMGTWGGGRRRGWRVWQVGRVAAMKPWEANLEGLVGGVVCGGGPRQNTHTATSRACDDASN